MSSKRGWCRLWCSGDPTVVRISWVHQTMPLALVEGHILLFFLAYIHELETQHWLSLLVDACILFLELGDAGRHYSHRYVEVPNCRQLVVWKLHELCIVWQHGYMSHKNHFLVFAGNLWWRDALCIYWLIHHYCISLRISICWRLEPDQRWRVQDSTCCFPWEPETQKSLLVSSKD